MPTPDARAIERKVLAWYDRHRRRLPWRAPMGGAADPYRVWLSEIMLQQTTVATVGPRFRDFVKRWPTLHDLAAARLDDVLHAWQGLGYYARARNLHACAEAVVQNHQGRFPEDQAALRALPGIGAYTASAIAAIAFGKTVVPVDANIARVVARLFLIADPLPGAMGQIRTRAAQLAPDRRPGDFAQALMDLGAGICTPRAPSCGGCPLAGLCAAAKKGVAGELPVKPPRRKKPLRRGVVFWTVRDDGAVLLRRRPRSGLLGGMMEVPSSTWRAKPWTTAEARPQAPLAARWRRLPGAVTHGFTHFALELTVLAGRVGNDAEADGVWCTPDRFADHALPTLMKKVIRHALEADGGPSSG